MLADGKADQRNREPRQDSAISQRACHRPLKFWRCPGSELRELYTKHQIFYVYHDRIDAAGRFGLNRANCLRAAEETLRELLNFVKKWTNANATNILITADHGFLYQDIPLEQAYYLSESPQGDAVTSQPTLRTGEVVEAAVFHDVPRHKQGLVGDIDIQIPKSIHRILAAGTAPDMFTAVHRSRRSSSQ